MLEEEAERLTLFLGVVDDSPYGQAKYKYFPLGVTLLSPFDVNST